MQQEEMTPEKYIEALEQLLTLRDKFSEKFGHLFDRDNVIEITSDMKAHDAARVQSLMHQIHDYMDSNKSMVGSMYDYVRQNIVPEKMDEEGTSTAVYDGVGRVSLKSDIYCKILDQDALVKWLEDEDMDGIIKETVNSSTLKALLRRRLQEGKEIPDGIFQITPFTMATITKVTVKGSK